MKIIVVDDDEISLDLLGECLSEGGYSRVSLVASPIEALENIRQSEVAYDCILLDLSMPNKSGIELCSDIRALDRYQNTPILMITKHKDREAIKRAFANGATDYITKPFEYFEVLTRIKLAERLVQERQAAIDSYIAVQNVSRHGQDAPAAPTAKKRSSALAEEQFQITGDKLLSISVFRNYLEQVTRAEDCKVSLLAIKVRRIDQIFAGTDAVEFIEFLKRIADVIICEFELRKVFLSHTGNGVFLCAIDDLQGFEPSILEEQIREKLQPQDDDPEYLQGVTPEIIVGSTLKLNSTPKLNFNRAQKAALARMEQRDVELSEIGISAMNG